MLTKRLHAYLRWRNDNASDPALRERLRRGGPACARNGSAGGVAPLNSRRPRPPKPTSSRSLKANPARFDAPSTIPRRAAAAARPSFALRFFDPWASQTTPMLFHAISSARTFAAGAVAANCSVPEPRDASAAVLAPTAGSAGWFATPSRAMADY